MQRWGKNRNGSIRFRCKHCGSSSTKKRSDLSNKYKKDLFQNWLLGKASNTEIAGKYGITRQTLHTWFTSFWDGEPLPNLFKYLLYPQIPNTTNFVEGAVNSQLQEKLRFHRGLTLLKRRTLIAHFLSSKQKEKPTQNLT